MSNYENARSQLCSFFFLLVLMSLCTNFICDTVLAQTQTFIDYTPAFVGDSVQIRGLNSRGDFCGEMYNKTDFKGFPFVYLRVATAGLDTGLHRITHTGLYDIASVMDIDENGVLVGYYKFAADGRHHAAKWVGGVLTDLDNDPLRISNAYSISEGGSIGGSGAMTSPLDTSLLIGFVFRSNGTGLSVLPTLIDSCPSVSFSSMNNSGVILGNYGVTIGDPGVCSGKIIIWSGGSPSEVSKVTGFEMLHNSHQSGLYNNAGQILGQIKELSGLVSSYGILQNGAYTKMPSLGVLGDNIPFYITDRGQIGGSEVILEGSRSVPHGTLYLPADAHGLSTGVYDMNDIVTDINLIGYSTRIKAVTRLLPNGVMLVHVGNKFNGQRLHHILKPVSVGPFIELFDASVFDGPISNALITIHKIANDPPSFTTTLVDTVVTDSDGLVDLAFYVGNGTLNRGDSVKFTRVVFREPSVKHPASPGEAYRIEVDNGLFDALGKLTFDTLTLSAQAQRVKLTHATVVYNLLVSVEWDAEIGFLQSLEQSFRNMTNYAYDVADGQLRFDTILIFDDKQEWNSADIRIHADNTVHPHVAAVDGIKRNNDPIEMPRMWFGSVDKSIDYTFFAVPLDLADQVEHRTLFHEFGHYAMSFYDEYRFPGDGVRCAAHPIPDKPYGFMDYQYQSADPYASEMSSFTSYTDNSCRNNKQWKVNRASCWSVFNLYSGTFNDMVVDFLTPTERELPAGLDYFPGPNTHFYSFGIYDYDVGALVEFPNVPAMPNGTRSALVRVRVPFTGDSLPNARVRTTRTSDLRVTIQGNTATNGWMYALGVGDNDIVYAAGWTRFQPNKLSLAAGDREWLVAESTIGTGDSLVLDMVRVNGIFPLIPQLRLTDSSASYSLQMLSQFQSAPRLSYSSGSGTVTEIDFVADANGYSTLLDSLLSSGGMITIWATDDSGATFFFDTDYSLLDATGSADAVLMGPNGGAEVHFDTSASGVYRASLLSSPYPVLRGGLSSFARQASLVYSLDKYPAGLDGETDITIPYSTSDLVGELGTFVEELSIRIHRWDEVGMDWLVVGGTVDTLLEQVSVSITETGVYAAFTTDIGTDIDDGSGDIGNLPYRFELSQNYPNPFNPTTVIEYSLDRSAHVKLELFNILGQKIRTLVDQNKKVGSYTISWDGKDASGKSVATGVYLYRFAAGEHVATKKMLLLK